MATQSSPESVNRKPLPPPGSPSKYIEGDYKENAGNEGRKPLPKIPIPSSTGRMHGAPMSPVRVNVQPEDWPPKASVAVIEDGVRMESQTSRESEQFEPERYEHRMPLTTDLPYRPNPNTEIQRPQAAVMSSGDSSSSRSPSNGSSNQPSRRGYPERIDENDPANMPVPRLQYHHQSHYSDGGNGQMRRPGLQSPSTPELVEAGQSINRHLTPNSQMGMRNSIQRPMSAYSDMGPRGRSPGLTGSPHWGTRAPSAHSGRSDSRPISYIDLNNVSYPQAPPPPISLDNSQLRSVVGSNASLLSMGKTLEMYRQNVKKLNDAETQYAFAIFLIQAAQEAGLNQEPNAPRKLSPKPGGRDLDSPYIEKQQSSPQELLSEAKHILQRLSDRSYPFAQYYLADGYASGLFSKGKEDYNTAFPLFVSASKHGHAESGYRAALCYEFGWGCRKDVAKAVQFYRQSASKNHPGAMTRLGRACLSGDLGLNKYREGLKWLKRATESADVQYNQAPYHLGLLYETGYGDDIFLDESYAAQLFTQAADLGHPEACYRLGDAYEHGKLSCPRDPALSVHFYTGAAQRGHPAAMMALCAWYMVGAPPVLEKDENEAYEWARQAADAGLTKAEYAVGYFTEMGIGCRRDPLEANVWYVKAADAGDERAKVRLAAIRAAASGGAPMEVAPPKSGKMKKSQSGNEKTGLNEKDKDCVVM
ncbi:HCP-like protein [Mollisia scopiformis]|uniref:HCP-like protein n=1 Tax=Mollisia scopiformis TaxID=149040 RepID=A0A194XQZ5_MOLSC|nr:HCP-like protein [Mollisia scopiformis]KUJ22710.1 HCP-like protein [Mollisia scopiformis]